MTTLPKLNVPYSIAFSAVLDRDAEAEGPRLRESAGGRQCRAVNTGAVREEHMHQGEGERERERERDRNKRE
jgi:hypothetical protein